MPKILEVGVKKKESSKVLRRKVEGIFSFEFIDVLVSSSHGSQDF